MAVGTEPGGAGVAVWFFLPPVVSVSLTASMKLTVLCRAVVVRRLRTFVARPIRELHDFRRAPGLSAIGRKIFGEPVGRENLCRQRPKAAFAV